MSEIEIRCDGCGKTIIREAKQVNYSRKRGKRIFCNKSCSGSFHALKTKGQPGKSWSEESKQKASKSHTGIPLSQNHRDAIQEAMHRPEVNQKISNAVKKAYEDPEMRERQREGTLQWFQTPEASQKISEGVRKAFDEGGLRERHLEAMNRPEVKEKLRQAKLGKSSPLSPEARKEKADKLTKKAKERWAGKSPEERRAHMQKAIAASMDGRSSSLETRIVGVLTEMGLEYIPQYQIGPYFADFFLPELNSIIEAYGCYWHGCTSCEHPSWNEKATQKARNKDKRREAYIRACGYDLLIIWEHEFSDDLAEKILELLCA